ncbi:MAG: AraC family transcriptional regulator [Bacteroidota bacterium]
MALKLHLADAHEIMYESGQQHYQVDKAGTQELHYVYNYKDLDGWYKEILMQNIRIGYGNHNLSKPTTLLFEFDKESVEMHFTLGGKSQTLVDASHLDFSMGANTHFIFYCDSIKGEMHFNAMHNYLFEINITPSFFAQYLPQDQISELFKSLIQQRNKGFLGKWGYPVTPKMLILIQEIMNCSWKDKYRILFLESKVLELLLLQLEQINQFAQITTDIKTPKSIVEKMYHAKEVIMQKLDAPLGISDLAKAVNTNECTLKREFKNVFGTTIFAYIRDINMERAKNMLLEENLSIAHIAGEVGYKYPQHFATAFKRKYGVSPSELKN